ncbi:GvpL/GvpF family gas vesicle protein [Streptomyces sp. NBC_01276]|uniref:GvpL/GvpF family gas vesicle protein n=1 Tax=Streptomyces sp. NBC_01276 TaxID=2903808 RepID=UPI00352F2058
MNTSEPALTYVYAVAARSPGLDEVVGRLHGVAGTSLTLLPTSGVGPGSPVFAVSRVPAADWNGQALKARFEDLGWLEATARAHHEVVEALAARTTVLPLRLATLYEDTARALTALHEQHDLFAERLALLAGHTEFGVKAYIAPATTGPDPPPADMTSPGKAYLRSRRAQQHARDDQYRQAAGAAQHLTDTAARYASARVRHPVQSGPLAGDRDGENVLNDAYLVPDDRADDFRAAIEQEAAHLPGIRVDVTGPWAPYSFATPPPGPPDGGDLGAAT